MSVEVERPLELVNPVTGEALSLDSPTEDLALFIVAVRDVEAQVRERKQAVTQELLRRMDKSASWSLNVAGMKLSAPSPAPVEEWDGAELRTHLLEMVDEGMLDMGAVDAAVETVVTYKPRKAGIRALRKLGGEVAAMIDSLARTSEPRRYVKVER